MVYVCFIVDAYSRMIVGWRIVAHMRTGMVPDALEMAINEWANKARNARKGFGSWADLVADGHINNKKKKKKEHRLWRVEGLQVSQ